MKKRSKQAPVDFKALSQLAHAAKAAKKKAVAELREWPLTDARGGLRDVASPADCETVAAWVTRQVATGLLGATEGKVITIAVSAWLKANAAGAMAKRVKELEALLARLMNPAAPAIVEDDDPDDAALNRLLRRAE